MREALRVCTLRLMSTLTALKKTAHKLLLDYSRTEAEARTPLTRELAALLVEARSHFEDAEGDTDWKGKTYPYRQWVREVFDDAHLTGEESKRVQAAIRYHVGAVLRDRLDPEEQERIGLIPQTPRERSSERRQTRSAVLNALNARDVAGGSLMAVTAMHAIAQRVDREDLAALEGSEREVAVATLKDLDRRTKDLLRALR